MDGSATYRLLRELEQRGCRPVVVASHPRSGTHLGIDTLRLNFAQCRMAKRWFEHSERLYLPLDRFGRSDTVQLSVIRRLLCATERPLVKTHAEPDLAGVRIWGSVLHLEPELGGWLRRNADLIYVYRDGREVLRSLWQFLGQFVPESRVSFSEFLRQRVQGVSRPRAWAQHVRGWLADPRAYPVPMERLLRQPAAELEGIARRLGIERSGGPARLPRKCGVDLLSRLSRRVFPSPASTAIVTHPRFVRFGRWQEVFSAEDAEFFRSETDDLVSLLGGPTAAKQTAAA